MINTLDQTWVDTQRASGLACAARTVERALHAWSTRVDDTDDELFDLERSIAIATRMARAAAGESSEADIAAMLGRACGKVGRAVANLDIWEEVGDPRHSDRELRLALRALYREADTARRTLCHDGLGH